MKTSICYVVITKIQKIYFSSKELITSLTRCALSIYFSRKSRNSLFFSCAVLKQFLAFILYWNQDKARYLENQEYCKTLINIHVLISCKQIKKVMKESKYRLSCNRYIFLWQKGKTYFFLNNRRINFQPIFSLIESFFKV